MGDPEGDETLRPDGNRPSAERFSVGGVVAERYRIVRFIASGGMGEIYAAHDLVLDTTVALKTLRPELEGSATAIERLRREIALARNVTNPHICRLHDVGEHDGRVFLTMELLDGRTLAEHVKSGGLPIVDVEWLAAQLIAGLGALHAASIIHRDFKTSNVIVVGERAVITDFGLARSVESTDQRLTLESGMLGTPAYMAPEQVEARAATTATDIYSLGVVLFELLTGKLPFDEDTPMATATARLHRDPPKPSSLAKVPARWDAIVMRCLEREPAKRFARVEDLLAHRPPSRRGFLVAGGGAATASALGVWWWQSRERVKPAATRALSAGEICAVLPIGGSYGLLDDPLRLALTLDIHDALGTTGLPMLAIHSAAQDTSLAGAAWWVGRKPDPVTTALSLPHVTTVVDSKIKQADERIALEVTLSQWGSTGWNLHFECHIREVGVLVTNVATQIATSLGFPAPRPARDMKLLTPPNYARYGRALSNLFRKLTPHEKAAGIGFREQALEQLVTDVPHLARASALLAYRYQGRVEQFETLEEALPLFAKADQLIERALTIDPDNAIAHATKGYLAMLRWNWKLADAETKRGAELSSHERAQGPRNMFLMMTGRFDEATAIAERQTARNPHERLGNAFLAWHYLYARRYPDVVRVVEPVWAKFDFTNPWQQIIASCLPLALYEMSRFDDAMRYAERLRAAKVDNYVLAQLLPVYVMAGRKAEAKAIRAEIGDNVDLAARTAMDDALGDIEPALQYLEKVVASHNLAATFLQVERFSPALRSDPRFQALLKKVGFP